MQNVRIISTARALIVCENKLLLVSNDGDFWYAPGGWVDGFEHLNETCKREIFEELGIEIEIEDISKVCHYKIKAEDNAPFFENINKIEHYFLCKPITMPKLDGESNLWVDEDNALVKHAKWFEIDKMKNEYQNYNIQPKWLRNFEDGNIFEI